MRILVTGANGQLGTALQKREPSLNFQADFLDSTQLDIIEFGNAINVISKFKPKIIINTAGWTDVDLAESHYEAARLVNAVGPANLALIAKELGSQFIHISTDYVFSGASKKPWNIDDPINPESNYGKTKAEGELAVVEKYVINSLIFRTSWLFSPFRKNFAKTMVRLALTNENTVEVVDDQIGQPTSAIDLANQILYSITKNLEPGIYHATNSGQTTWKGFAEEIFKLIGADPNRIVGIGTSELNRPAPRPKYSVLSHDCWVNTGIAPMRNWREALVEQIDEIKDSVIKEGFV